MITLAGCSTRQRILVAGSKSMELMLELHRRRYLLAAAAGNCGRPTGQYDVALVDGGDARFTRSSRRWIG
jgi:hypothetical protein